jgi:hypothetical protein
MKLIQRHRNATRNKVPRIEISQAEITADLIYPARRQADAAAPRLRGSRR